jgi:WASH complex subunit 7
MYDEMIQSPLIREDRYFLQNKEKLNGHYPFERAEALYREIGRLGHFDDLKTFMDKLRELISQIGNALG